MSGLTIDLVQPPASSRHLLGLTLKLLRFVKRDEFRFSFAVIAVFFLQLGYFPLAFSEEARVMMERAQKLSPSQLEMLKERYQTPGVRMNRRAEDIDFEEEEDTAIEQFEPREDEDLQAYLRFLEFMELEKESDAELRRFGIDFFDEETTTLSRADNVPVPEGYIVGLGDELYLNTVGTEVIDRELRVQRDGSILIPRIGVLSIGGMNFSQAKTLIEETIASQLVGTKAYVSMGRLKDKNIYLTGEVKRPGSYSVAGTTTVTQALYLSGGISEIGSLRNVQLKRSGETVGQFDLYDLLLKGDRSKDVQLDSGDVIFVPVAKNSVQVKGEVHRPAVYEVIDGETLQELIVLAGGTTSKAYRKVLSIERMDRDLGQRRVLNVELGSESASSVKMIDGDIVKVGETTDQLFNSVAISGSVVREGTYSWANGYTVSEYIGSIEQDLKVEADLDVGLIVRRINKRLDVQVIPFSVIDALSKPESRFDPELLPYDQIVVLPLPDVIEELLVVTDNESAKASDEEDLPENQDISIAEESVDQESEIEKTDGNDLRQALLAPIINKLKTQAGAGKPAEVVSISGAVRMPGDYPLLNGKGIDDDRNDLDYLVALAGGLKDGAHIKNIEIRRLDSSESGSVKTRFVTVDMNDLDSDFRLQSRDLVRISFLAGWNPNEKVEISGEVNFPGTYAIGRGETLFSVIQRAGGFTSSAHIEGLKYFSKSIQEAERDRAKSLIRRFQREQASRRSIETNQSGVSGVADSGGINSEDFEKTILDSLQGRMVVDVPRLLAGNPDANVVLQDGDRVEVPVFLESITVTGEVLEPGSFRFDVDKNVDDYLLAAAGLTERAERESIYVIKANGEVISMNNRKRRFMRFDTSNGNGKLTAGSVIVVPTNYDYQPLLDRYRSISGAVFESVTTIAALLSISSN